MGFWDSIGDAFTSFGDDVANVATTGANAIASGVTTAADAVANTATTAVNAIGSGVTTAADDVTNVATTGANDIKNIAVSGSDLVANFTTGTLKNFAEGSLIKALSLIGLGGSSNPNVSGSQTYASYAILIVGGIVGLMLLLLIFDLLGMIF